MTWSPFLTEVTPGPMSTTTPAPSWPRMAGNSPSGSAPERVNSSVWQMPVALISTSTSPAFGPSSVTVVTSSGLPLSNATAARTSIDRSFPDEQEIRRGAAFAAPLVSTPPFRNSSLRLRHDADIGLGRLPALRILLLGVLVGDRSGDDDVLAVLPIHRRRH